MQVRITRGKLLCSCKITRSRRPPPRDGLSHQQPTHRQQQRKTAQYLQCNEQKQDTPASSPRWLSHSALCWEHEQLLVRAQLQQLLGVLPAQAISTSYGPESQASSDQLILNTYSPTKTLSRSCL